MFDSGTVRQPDELNNNGRDTIHAAILCLNETIR